MAGLKLNGLDLKKISSHVNVPNFTKEIQDFEKTWKNKNDESKKLNFPVNQEKIMKDVLRVLASKYPNVVLTGSPGVGKSMTLDKIIEILTGKVDLNYFGDKLSPEIKNLFTKVSKKLEEYHNYKNFLLLPDLKNNNEIKPLVFSSHDELEKNSDQARIFSENIINFFDNTVPRNLSKIKKKYSKDDFLTYLYNENSLFFQNLYMTFNDILFENGYDDEFAFPLMDINFKKNNNNKGKQSLELKLDIDFTDITHDDSLLKSFNIDIDEKNKKYRESSVNDLVQNIFVKTLVESQIQHFFKDLKSIKVNGLNSSEISNMIYSEFNSISNKVNEYISNFSKKDDYDTKEYSFEKNFEHKYIKKPVFDDETYKFISSNILKICNNISDKDLMDKNLKTWIDSIGNYFTTNKKSLDDMLNNYFEEIENIKKPDTENENIKMKMFFADKTYFPLENIFAPYAFYGTNFEKVTSKNLENFNPNTSFFNFLSNGVNPANPSLYLAYPPHTKILGFGDFFKADILYFKDSFKEVIKKISQPARFEGEKPDNFKEKFLEFLQTSVFTYSHESASYNFYSPKMILAAGNEDPFNLIEDGYKETREDGLEARITQIYVPTMVENTSETRKGTLEVLYSTVHQFNSENETDINLDIDSVNYLLNSMVLSKNLISVKYRDFTKEIEKICNYAKFKDSNINLKLLTGILKEDLNNATYSITDEDYSGIEGYEFMPENQAGTTNGLAVTNSGVGTILRANSEIIYDKLNISSNNRFNFIDLDSGMTDETTFKGFILATNYVKKYLSQIEDKDLLSGKFGWQISTQFYKNLGKVGGNSASTAIAASIISSISETPIYNSRFITGTLESDGVVGAIGGVYEKGSVPARFNYLSNNKEKYTFLFPLSNLQDLNRELVLDPFDLKSRVEMVPIETFSQAYELLTNPNITPDIILNSQRLGISKLENDLLKIETNLKKFYKPKKKFFLF